MYFHISIHAVLTYCQRELGELIGIDSYSKLTRYFFQILGVWAERFSVLVTRTEGGVRATSR